MTATLSDTIRALIEYARDMEVDDFEAALDAASDDLATGERSDDLFTESLIDGIRWGLRAAMVVEFGGGTILRVRKPGGVCISHEWHKAVGSAIAYAAVMQTVDEAMGREGGARAVQAVWDEASRAQADAIRERLAEVADKYDFRGTGEGARALRDFAREIDAMMGAGE